MSIVDLQLSVWRKFLIVYVSWEDIFLFGSEGVFE